MTRLIVCILAMIAALGASAELRADDARVLREAGVQPEVEAVARLLGSVRPTAAQAQRAAYLVERLGARSYRVREQASQELVRIGSPAIAALRAGAKHEQLEVRVRCQAALRAIGDPDGRQRVLVAAARWVGAQGDARALPALRLALEHGSQRLRAEARDASGALLARLPDGRQRALLMLDDAFPPARLLALRWLGRQTADPAALAGRLAELKLTRDVDAAVRLEAGLLLLAAGRRAGLAPLGPLLSHEQQTLRYRAVSLLRAVSGKRLGYRAADPQPEPIRRWTAWVEAAIEPGGPALAKLDPRRLHQRELPAQIGLHKGMTWTVRARRHGCVLVGADKQTNAYQGDQPAGKALPMLAVRKINDGPPAAGDAHVKRHWGKVEVKLTRPIRGHHLVSLEAANKLIAEELGPGWTLADFHLGGGWRFWAKGDLPLGEQRFWVRIRDQPANPWSTLGPRAKARLADR